VARILIVDSGGNALDFAMRAQQADHDVKMFIRQTPKNEHIGKGLVDLVEDFRPWFRWADVVFLSDNVMYLRDIDNLRANFGVLVVGPSADAAQWELDRAAGQAIFKKHKIPVIEGKEFTDYDAAIAHVKKHDERFVSKPSGNVEDKALSYVSKSPADMVYMLERWKKFGKLKTPFILQGFVGGTEMAVGGWFGPGGFNDGWCENFEFKKLMAGDLGVATGEQGTVLRYVKSSKLARKVLAPLADALHKLKYVGYVDVNTIIDDKGNPWPLEFTMRPGWPTMNIQQPLHQGDPVECLIDLANGKDSRSVLMDKIAVGVVLSIPDYPYSHLTRREVTGIPIYGLTPGLWKHWHPCEMQLADNVPNVVNGSHVKMPMPATAGDYVGVMTAVADTVKDAALTCYRRLEKLIVPNSPMYRNDIGKKLAKQLPKIQQHDYATEMIYSQQS
jgi:phosphoribosylamine---glycine ligase